MFPFHRSNALRGFAIIALLAMAPARASEVSELRAQLDALRSD